MLTRPLGASGIEASVVALGAWQMGGWFWGGNPDEDSVRAAHASLDHGVNLIDTAAIYGFGHSELMVGKAIRGKRDKFIIATKCGIVANPTVGEPSFRTTAHTKSDFGHVQINRYNGPESIRQELELSLKRLDTDYIDLYQTHWQEPTTPIADTMGELMKMKGEGKIRAIGVCNATTKHMDQYRAAGRLDTDQEKYSMLDRALDAGQLPYCGKHHIAVLAYSPLSKGLLTGKLSPDRVFAPGDVRNGDDRFSPENRRRIQRMLDPLRPIAEDKGITLGQLTIAWTFHQPGLTHVLCGARNAEQAIDNAGAGDVTLSEDELKTINDAIDAYRGQAVAG